MTKVFSIFAIFSRWKTVALVAVFVWDLNLKLVSKIVSTCGYITLYVMYPQVDYILYKNIKVLKQHINKIHINLLLLECIDRNHDKDKSVNDLVHLIIKGKFTGSICCFYMFHSPLIKVQTSTETIRTSNFSSLGRIIQMFVWSLMCFNCWLMWIHKSNVSSSSHICLFGAIVCKMHTWLQWEMW